MLLTKVNQGYSAQDLFAMTRKNVTDSKECKLEKVTGELKKLSEELRSCFEGAVEVGVVGPLKLKTSSNFEIIKNIASGNADNLKIIRERQAAPSLFKEAVLNNVDRVDSDYKETSKVLDKIATLFKKADFSEIAYVNNYCKQGSTFYTDDNYLIGITRDNKLVGINIYFADEDMDPNLIKDKDWLPI